MWLEAMTSKPGFLKFITTTKSTKLFETLTKLFFGILSITL